MIIKEFRELRRDKRTLGLLVGLPVLLLIVFGYAANFSVDSIPTAVVGQQAQALEGQLPDTFDVVITDESGDRSSATQLLVDGEVPVAFIADSPQLPVTALVDGASLFTAQTAVSILNRFQGQVQTDILFNPDLITAWVMVPAIIGLILLFIGTVITSIGMVRERESGTLEQLAVMPIKPSSVIMGKIGPYFILAAIDMILVTLLGMWLFDVPFNGNPLIFVAGGAVFLFVVLGVGVFISTVSKNAGQAIQTAFFFLLPQILLSGMIFPLEAIPWAVRWISYLLPLTYFTDISQSVMLRGSPLSALWLPLLILTVMAVLSFAGSVLRFRRDLAPARHASRHKGRKRNRDADDGTVGSTTGTAAAAPTTSAPPLPGDSGAAAGPRMDGDDER